VLCKKHAECQLNAVEFVFHHQPLCSTALVKKPFGGWPGWKLYSIIHRLLDNICDAQRYRAQFGRLAGG